MKERPILFSGPMVQAILAGRKTQTRRVIKWHPLIDCGMSDNYIKDPDNYVVDDCPLGKAGDRLWVREAWRYNDLGHGPCVEYRAGGDVLGLLRDDLLAHYPGAQLNWRPSIFMPRWASRLTLEITGVRVQHLQDISEEDADAEGFGGYPPPYAFPTHYGSTEWYDGGKSIVECFAELWDSLNAKRGGYSWESNPWVWALTFQRV